MTPSCKIENCNRTVYVKQMCRPHYRATAKYGDPLYVRPASRCAVDSCARPFKAKGYCDLHLARVRSTGIPGPADALRARHRALCYVEGCGATSNAKGLCPRHYQRLTRFGDPLVTPPGAHPEGPIRSCKWCGTDFDRRVGGRLLTCSEKCRRILDLLTSGMGRYSLTPASYRALWETQGGVCKLCGRPASGKSEMLAVDHDHSCCEGQRSCGKCVRGLLCDPCNRGLGLLGDSPEILRRAATYIETRGGADAHDPEKVRAGSEAG